MADRKRLGRGLSAIFGEINEIDSNGVTISNIDIDTIKPNPYQPRRNFKENNIIELSNSIREKGVVQPILVRKSEDGFEIIAGERRLRASKLAGLTTIPAIIKDINNEESFEIAIIENIHRENLNPIEEALAYRTLMEKFSYTQDDLAKKLFRDRATIANTLRLLKLPDKIISMIKNNVITQGHARAILALKDKDSMNKLAEKVKENKLSVRETENEVYSLSEEKKYKSYEKTLKEILKRNVYIKYKKGRAKIEIDFYDEGDLVNFIKIISK